MRQFINCLLVIVAAAVLSSAAPQRSRSPEPRPIPPILSWSGAFSEIHVPTIERAVNREQWAALWKRHMGRKIERNATNVHVIPEIDFDSCMAVAVFSGEMTQSNGNSVATLLEFDDHLLLRYKRLLFEVSVRSGGDARLVDVTPYGIFIVPRSDKRIEVEEEIPSMFGRPPEARSIGVIPAR